MVNRNIIEKTFNILIKCSIRTRLNKLTIFEKRELLDNKMNSREKDDYEMLMDLYLDLTERLSDENYTGGKRKIAERRLGLVEDRLYNYDKRIFQDYEVGIPKGAYDFDTLSLKESNRFEIGEFNHKGEIDIEAEQLWQQLKYELKNNITITDKEISDIESYIHDGFSYINGSIYGTNFWNNLNDEEKNMWRGKLPSIKQGIDSVIDKSVGLTQDTVLYHGGYWDISLEVGQHFEWKGYTSFSYRENVARSFMMGKTNPSDMDNWLVVAYSPTGMKGAVIEDSRFNSIPGEHELLTGRGQGGTVYHYDEKNHIVYVVLDK